MTAEVALRLGRAVAERFRRPGRGGRIVIGKDTRLSGYMLESALEAGIVSAGADAMLVGPMPTPGIAFITSSMRADAGVVISASHNPYQDNGIKIFASDGFKLPDEVEADLEKLMDAGLGASGAGDRAPPWRRAGSSPPEPIAGGHGDPLRVPMLTSPGPGAELALGKAVRIGDAEGRYVQYLKNAFPRDRTLDGIRIAVDCANGAAYRVAPMVFEELGAEVVPLGREPDGRNINHQCGALFPENTAAAVRGARAEIGIALDGDADRVVLVDAAGRTVDGDEIMAILGTRMLERGTLPQGTVVATVMSNLGLERALVAKGGRLRRTAVGDRYVVEAMREGGFTFGGEQSGHVIFLDHSTTGDGILAALQVLRVMVQEGKALADLLAIMTRYPQVLVNLKVPQKLPIEDLPLVVAAIADAENALGGDGRVLVRYSGTEPKARVMIEGTDERLIRAHADEIARVLQESLQG